MYYAYCAEFKLNKTKFLSSKSLDCSFLLFFFLVGLIASAIFSTTPKLLHKTYTITRTMNMKTVPNPESFYALVFNSRQHKKDKNVMSQHTFLITP
jgi:hypothetical protein